MSGRERAQIAWKAIANDIPVFSSEGEEAARVTQVVGDRDADVFTGLALRVDTLGPDRFLPSERVRTIYEDRIDVAATKAELEALPEHEDTPVVRWRPDEGGGILRRLFRR